MGNFHYARIDKPVIRAYFKITMISLNNYMLFFEHLYDYPGNINSLLEVLGRQLPLIAKDIKLAKMEVDINFPQLFCDRFPFHYKNVIFDTKKETDLIPVSTDFFTDHDGIITITAFAEKDTNWTREETKEIIFLNEQIMVLLTRSRLQSQLKKAEETDNITNVLNLAGIMHVGELLTIKKILPKFSVLSLNINDFTKYNKQYGHVNGDLILKAYATNLSDFIGKDGVIGRIGADNFIVIIATSRVETFMDYIKDYSLEIEMDNMEKEKLSFSTRTGICDGVHSQYFPQLFVNAKHAMERTEPEKGILSFKHTSQ